MSKPAREPQIIFNVTINVPPEWSAIFATFGPQFAAALARSAGETPRPAPAAMARDGARPNGAPPPTPGAARTGWRTPERAAVVRELWPTSTPAKEVLARCSALPGPPIPPPGAYRVGIWAASLGLKRPRGTPNPFRKRAAAAAPDEPAPAAGKPPSVPDVSEPVPEQEAPSAPATEAFPAASEPDLAPALPPMVPARPIVPAKPAQTAAPAAATVRQTWSAERTALVRRDYPVARIRTADLLAQINALPGAPISEAWLHNYAVTALKLSRRSDAPRQPDAPPAPSAVRRVVAREAIESWCMARGWRFERFDIDAINQRCAAIGHPGFGLLEPSRRGASV